MGKEDRINVWSERWEQGKTTWHEHDVSYALKNHGKLLLTGPRHRVFVPLCGKSVDLKWFYDGGHIVVGVEAVEQAILEFFTEQKMSYVTETLTWGKLFKTEDNHLLLYCCDLLNVDIKALGKFDAVWDRGSLVAVNEDDRESYVKLLKSLLAPDFHYLLNVNVYTPNEYFSGPPRNVPPELVECLYGDSCQMEHLETVTRSKDDPKLVKWGIKHMGEVTLLLTPRN